MSPGKAGISGLHSRLPRGVRPHLEGKQRILISSWVAIGISWSPLSGLQGVKPPVEFGERPLAPHERLPEILVVPGDSQGWW